jgi:arylsulfatase A
MTRMLLLLAVTLVSSPAIAADRLPNVVFFLVDDLGWTDLGCYGSGFYETPHVDKLAEEGVRFTQSYAACHVCSPTRASIVTGKYPARLRMTDWLPGRREFPFQRLKNAPIQQHLPFEEVTIAEALKEHGYRTAHFGKWHLGEDPSGPLQHGFDVQIPRWNKGWPKAGYRAPFQMEGLEDESGGYLTDRLTDEVLKFIGDNAHHPFFVYLSHFAVHDPIEGRSDVVKKYQAKQRRSPVGTENAFVLEGNPDTKNSLSQGKLDALMQQVAYQGYRVLPDRMVKIKQRQDNVQFAAMVECMDESLGLVLEKLKTLGIADNTIVVFVSDNGGMSAANFGRPERVIPASQLDAAYSTSNLPLRGGKGWLYEGGIRVPLIVKWPGQGKRAAVCNIPVISTDLYPTVLEMIGVPARPDQHIDGVSIAPLVKGAGELAREAVYWHFPHYSNHGMQSPGGAVRAGDYKLIEYFENNSIQLFNLQKDPGEKQNLAREEMELASNLRAKLHRWRENISAQMMQINPDYQSDQ